jgi:electron transfer flavoprotein beta subunit
MRILCLLKPVPDVDNLRYDSERNVLVRDNARLVVNPEDAVAVAVALDLKRAAPDTYIEIVSMAPRGAMPYLEDMVRRGVDRAILVSDQRYAGSDTWVTSSILARCMESLSFDCVFCGTHTLDGGTAQVPAQVAEALGLPHLAGISATDGPSFAEGTATVAVESDVAMLRFSVSLPAILGFQYTPKRRLPYIGHGDIDRDVSDRITVLGNDELKFVEGEIGLAGSLTVVRRVVAADWGDKEPVRLRVDAEGIEYVFRYLERKGLVRP